jgi:drug/metabolite transporter (DMT)-like permease
MAYYWKYPTYTLKNTHMKTLGFVLIIAGIAMIVVKGFSVQTEKKIIDAGPIQVNKKENRWVGWPTYAGAVVAVIGVVLVLSNGKKSA